MPGSLFTRYLEVLQQVAREFRRNKKLHGRRIHCRAGCTDCCHHLFQITELEAAQISRALKQMPDAQRETLAKRAKVYLPVREAIMKRRGYIEARGNLPSPETRLACPALLNDRCAIYEHRPLICRKYGMPLYHPDKPGRTFACELNFHPGEVIDDPQLVQIQTGIAENWKRLQRDYGRAGGRRAELPITVADAILNDFEDYPPSQEEPNSETRQFASRAT